MKRLIKKMMSSRSFNEYCVNMMNMYNIGRVNTPA